MITTLNCVMLIDDDKLVNTMNKILTHNVECSRHIIKRESAMSALYYLTKNSGSNLFPFLALKAKVMLREFTKSH